MSMCKYITGTLLLILSSTAFADGGAYISASVGTHSFSADAGIPDSELDGASRRVAGGYRWDAVGLEAGYSHVGSTQTLSTTGDGTLITQELKLSGWTLGAQGRFQLADRWHLLARGGLFRWKQALDIYFGGGHGWIDQSGTGWYAGLGIAVDIRPQFSLKIDADRYVTNDKSIDLEADVFSFGAEYRF